MVGKDDLFHTKTSWTPSKGNFESSKCKHIWNNNIFETIEASKDCGRGSDPFQFTLSIKYSNQFLPGENKKLEK